VCLCVNIYCLFLLVGGSICMQLLTRSGWSAASSIESVLVQIRAEMVGKKNK